MATSLLLAACSSGGDHQPDAQAGKPAAAGAAARDEQPSRAGAGHVEGSVQVSSEQIHPDNITLEVTKITAEENAVFVDIEGFNASPLEVQLSSSAFLPQLLIGGDRKLAFQELEGGSQIDVPSGADISGRLAFLGRIPADTEGLELRINWEGDAPFNAGSETVFPPFQFEDLPVPGER